MIVHDLKKIAVMFDAKYAWKSDQPRVRFRLPLEKWKTLPLYSPYAHLPENTNKKLNTHNNNQEGETL